MSVHSPVPGLFDTDVLRDIRVSHSPAVAFVLAYMKIGRIHACELAAMLLLAEAPDAAKAASVRYFFRGCKLLSITASISKRAHKLIAGFTPPSPLTPDDAIIAATALVHKLHLYTLDPAKFRIVPGLSALQPY